jgi:HEAT repeat protein
MSLTSRCSFCAKLPAAANHRAGRPGKCPLCKGDLVIAGGGVTFRLTDAVEAALCRRPGRTLLFAGVGVALLLVGALTGRALMGSGTPVERDAAAAQVAQVAVPEPPRRQPLRPSPSEDERPAWERLPAPALEEAPVAAATHVATVHPPPPPVREKIPPAAVEAEPPAATAVVRLTPAPPPVRYPHKHASEEDFRVLLARVPEVGLEPPGASVPTRVGARNRLENQAKEIHGQTAHDADAFVRYLEEVRADLAGLPFLKGKDCRLEKGPRGNWALLSRGIRSALARAELSGLSASRGRTEEEIRAVKQFWAGFERGRMRDLLMEPEAVPALQQMLQTEPTSLRASLVERLEKMTGKAASSALARRAVFDLDWGIRKEALAALSKRPAADYAPVLVEALRYPWVPAAQRAAEAIAALKLKELVPELIDLLEEPDPGEPFLAEVNGAETPVVRELVRINHFRNCLLCHAPSLDTKDLVRGLVPVPGERIPRAEYYSERRGGIFVRADITYLRQDFSVMLPVADSKPWPAAQRYDFLVRTRPITAEEKEAWLARAAPPEAGSLSDYKRTILSALEQLTGENAGSTARQWRDRLRVNEADRRAPAAGEVPRAGGDAVSNGQ